MKSIEDEAEEEFMKSPYKTDSEIFVDAYIAGANRDGWIKIAEGDASALPQDGIEVVGHNIKWVHPDFNINGTRICFVNNGDDWSNARWNNDQDSWITDNEAYDSEDCAPTHWQSLPKIPTT